MKIKSIFFILSISIQIVASEDSLYQRMSSSSNSSRSHYREMQSIPESGVMESREIKFTNYIEEKVAFCFCICRRHAVIREIGRDSWRIDDTMTVQNLLDHINSCKKYDEKIAHSVRYNTQKAQMLLSPQAKVRDFLAVPLHVIYREKIN